jgi:hypothetical protein
MLDLTAYLVGPSEQELDYLTNLYESIAPPDRLVKYTIAELQYWPTIAQPDLTASGRAAAAAGIKRPYLEPVRRRIRDGRAFGAQFWDGRRIDDPEGSWSFSCQRIHLRSTGLHAFVRFLVPLQTDHQVLRAAALAIADNVELYSGHGGLAFVYDPGLTEDALDAIYAQARRFWGIDVEDLTDTLPLMTKAIKGVNWITLISSQFASAPGIPAALDDLARAPDVTVEKRRHAVVLVAGQRPVVGDQHRPDPGLDSYYAVARALKPLFLEAHPDFPGERFAEGANTVGWIRRFVEPGSWR